MAYEFGQVAVAIRAESNTAGSLVGVVLAIDHQNQGAQGLMRIGALDANHLLAMT